MCRCLQFHSAHCLYLDMSASNTISDAALVSAGTLFTGGENTLVAFLPLCQSSETELERSKTTQVQVDVTQ